MNHNTMSTHRTPHILFGNIHYSKESVYATSSPLTIPRPQKLEKRPTKLDVADLPSPKSRIPARDRSATSDRMDVDSRPDIHLSSPLIACHKSEQSEQEAPIITVAEDKNAGSIPQSSAVVLEGSPSRLGRLMEKRLSTSRGNSRSNQTSTFQPKLQQSLSRCGDLDASTRSVEDKSVMVSASKVREIIETLPESSFLLLDLRVFPQFSNSRIKGALNLCIPTTLLKRPSFNLQKLNDTFTKDSEKRRFSQWPTTKHIIVYDAFSTNKKDASTALSTLRKFTLEGWCGSLYILQGGFKGFSQAYPSLIDHHSCEKLQTSKINLSIGTVAPAVAPVAGGCAMPLTKSVANPFFSNIRQNQDLIGGVGQIDIKMPCQITKDILKDIPQWLRKVTELDDHGKLVSNKYLRLEQEELATMTKALSSKVSYGTQLPDCGSIRIAGIEKGGKNRYNNIWPYEHSRVKLLNRPAGGCDYVNASHIKASRSNKRYIASQGPLPATFEDFWSVIWDQDIRVIVMLTAESEEGQIKCHNYWSAQNYGQFKLEALSETKVPLESRTKNEWGHRRATTIIDLTKMGRTIAQPISETPHAIVRKFALSHIAYPFSPLREITQVHYCSWPDLGAPASASQLLGLVELSNLMQRSTTTTSSNLNSQLDEPEAEDSRPMLVHCSAGCGRTGTFCTIDSVIDILKRQRKKTSSDPVSQPPESAPDNEFTLERDIDLVEKTVEDFRSQRLSMVQNLRQFVLCYETVLEWIAQQVTRGQKPPTPVKKTFSSLAIGINGGRDRCGSVF